MGFSISRHATLAATAVAGCLAATSSGAVGVYVGDPTQRAAFQADAGPGLALESFEDQFFAPSVSFPVGGPTAFTASVSTGNLSQNSFSRLVSDGSSAMGFEEENSPVVTFTFASAITAFGVDVLDANFVNMSYSDNAGNVVADAILGDDCSSAGGPGCEARYFFGIVSATPFTTVTLSYGDAGIQTGTLALDRLEYGTTTPVPLPIPLAALGSGLGLMALLRIRSRA
jgi:hypothetical protein